MTRGRLAFLAIFLGFSFVIAGTALATAQTQEPIYGGQLMTQQEIRDYQEKIRSASSDEERQQIRREHRREMQERAKRKGVVLRDQPIVPGMRMGVRSGEGGDPRAGQ